MADIKYKSNVPLTYSSPDPLEVLNVVSVPLKSRIATGFVLGEVKKPPFLVKPIKNLVTSKPLPYHCLQLAQWMEAYYAANLSETLRQFAPTKPAVQGIRTEGSPSISQPELLTQLQLQAPLTVDQKRAISEIKANPSTTILLHGETGTGKTRVYLELAKQSLHAGKSVILLTPEISLTTQLAAAAQSFLSIKPVIIHSQLSAARRKQLWLKAIESAQPQIVVGPRSALFSPLASIGLVVVDEAHEPAYKQEQTPRYNALRVASQLGVLADAKVIYGTATPNIADYYLAQNRRAVVRMTQRALGKQETDAPEVKIDVVDMKDRKNFASDPYISKQMIEAIGDTLKANKQVLVYLNRRGSARVILCDNCGWRDLCPNCDVSLVYHADNHQAKCHICGYQHAPPKQCPNCANTDIIFRTIGTKALSQHMQKLFPQQAVRRFDSDNKADETLNEVYADLVSGKAEILVGTQLLAKGLDLPKLGLVCIVSAESSLSMPDFTAEERTFQLLYQVIGRVGRGHVVGEVVVQTYQPNSIVIQSAIQRDYQRFYAHTLAERQTFRFPPFSYLMKSMVRRATLKGAQDVSDRLKSMLIDQSRPVEVIGPTPAFYARRGKYFHYQVVVKSKDRDHLLALAKVIPQDWQIDLDPVDLL